MPDVDLLVVTLDRAILVFALGDGPRGVGIVDKRPSGRPAGPFARRLRQEIVGATVETIAIESPGLMRLGVERGGIAATLIVCWFGRHPNAVLVGETDRVVAAMTQDRRGDPRPGESWTPPPSRVHHTPATSVDELMRAGPELLAQQDRAQIERARRSLVRSLARAAQRLERRIVALESDTARALEAPSMRAHASIILTNLHAIERGAQQARAMDWASDPPREIVIELDPALDARHQAERMFHRARRLERGALMAETRRAATDTDRRSIVGLRQRCEETTTIAGLRALAEEAARLKVRGALDAFAADRPGRAKGAPARVPYRRFVTEGDEVILVGRGAADNDELTLRHSRPGDLWLHARGVRGAHVLVPLGSSQSCPAGLLVDAATLAAHFSDARGEPIVEVQYAQRRHVRKPRGAGPGEVVVDREKVLALRLEPQRLSRLLACERPT